MCSLQPNLAFDVVFHEDKHHGRSQYCLVVTIQVLTALRQSTLLNFMKKANHSTCVAIKTCFHSKIVEVTYIPVLFHFTPSSLGFAPNSPTELTMQTRGRSLQIYAKLPGTLWLLAG